jgi:hypothetical protein
MQLTSVLKSKLQIIYKDPYGNILNIFDETNLFSFELSLKESDYSSLYIDFPNEFDTSYFKKDYILEIWRKVGDFNYYLEGETVFFIRLIRYKYAETGEKYIHILAYSALHLLNRRIVPFVALRDGNDDYIAGYAYKNGKCDDVIRSIILENFSSSAVDTTRRYPSDMFVVGPSLSIGPNIVKEFSNQKILPLIQSIIEYSIQKGTYMAVDVIKSSEFVLSANIYVDQRGIDRGSLSPSTLTFSLARGNLSYCTIARDYVGEFNHIYADNGGDSESRIFFSVQDLPSIEFTPWSRIEDYYSTGMMTQADIEADANYWLADHLGKIKTNAHIIQTEDCLYGVHYNFGDVINIFAFGISTDVHINEVSLKVSRENADEIKIFARNLEDTEY